MSRAILIPVVLAAFAVATPAWAQQRQQDAIQKMYDAPLRKMYEDPLRKMYPEPGSPFGNQPSSIYPPNRLIPGGQPQAPRTLNEAAPGSGAVASQPNPANDARFRRFDRNNDGQISREEYVGTAMQRAPVNPSVADLQRDSLRRRFESRFGGADGDRNRSISRDEYDNAINPRF